MAVEISSLESLKKRYETALSWIGNFIEGQGQLLTPKSRVCWLPKPIESIDQLSKQLIDSYAQLLPVVSKHRLDSYRVSSHTPSGNVMVCLMWSEYRLRPELLSSIRIFEKGVPSSRRLLQTSHLLLSSHAGVRPHVKCPAKPTTFRWRNNTIHEQPGMGDENQLKYRIIYET